MAHLARESLAPSRLYAVLSERARSGLGSGIPRNAAGKKEARYWRVIAGICFRGRRGLGTGFPAPSWCAGLCQCTERLNVSDPDASWESSHGITRRGERKSNDVKGEVVMRKTTDERRSNKMRGMSRIALGLVMLTVVGASVPTYAISFRGAVTCQQEEIGSETAWAIANSSGAWGTSSAAVLTYEVGTDPLGLPLVAGQHYDAGTVSVYTLDGALGLAVNLTDPWFITSLHVYVGDSPPPTVGKRNNLVPGSFPYSTTFAPEDREQSPAPLSFPECVVGDVVYICVHAVVGRLVPAPPGTLPVPAPGVTVNFFSVSDSGSPQFGSAITDENGQYYYHIPHVAGQNDGEGNAGWMRNTLIWISPAPGLAGNPQPGEAIPGPYATIDPVPPFVPSPDDPLYLAYVAASGAPVPAEEMILCPNTWAYYILQFLSNDFVEVVLSP